MATQYSLTDLGQGIATSTGEYYNNGIVTGFAPTIGSGDVNTSATSFTYTFADPQGVTFHSACKEVYAYDNYYNETPCPPYSAPQTVYDPCPVDGVFRAWGVAGQNPTIAIYVNDILQASLNNPTKDRAVSSNVYVGDKVQVLASGPIGPTWIGYSLLFPHVYPEVP